LRQAVKSKEAISIRDLYASQLYNLDRDIWNGPFAGKVGEKSAEAMVAAFARGEAAPYTIPVVPGQDVRIESPRA
jgi:hypothetical protein